MSNSKRLWTYAGLLAELFSTIAEWENMVELARKELSDHDSFEPYAAFCRLGGFHTAEIDERDVAEFWNSNGIHWDLNEAALIISQYDENGNGKLSFHEFSSMVLPATNATLRAMAISRDYSWMVPKTAFLEETLEHALALVFLRELDYQRRVEDIKTELNLKHDFTTSSAFKLIDTGNPFQRIDRYEIRSFVNDHLRWLEEEDLDAIIRRCDTDGDELLVFSEFDDAVKNAKIVRTIPRIEEILAKPGRFGSEFVHPTELYTPVVRTIVHHEPVPVPIEEVKYSSLREKYVPIAHSPPRMSRYSSYTTPISIFHSRREASPLRGYEEEELAESFIDLISLERELEISKQALALRPDFTLNDAYGLFCNSSITEYEIRQTFGDYGVPISLEEARLILSRYDRDCDGHLRFDELIDMFLPKDLSTSDALADRSSLYPYGYYTSPYIHDVVTRSDFVRVLSLNLKVENHAESIRQKHAERPLFNPIDAFNALNKYRDVSLTKDDFANLLANHRFFPTNNELNTLIDRFDKNRDGRVSYGEFVDEITPHSPERF